MGRRKLKMELIPKAKERMSSFKKRKESLTKKFDELKTLCGVDGCMIIYHPNGEAAEPEIYPESLYETCRVIDEYRSKKDDPTKCKTVGLSDFFQERKRKAEEQLMKMRKENMNAKYPTWNNMLDEVTDPLVLRAFADQLSVKSHIVKSRIEFLKSISNQVLDDNNNNFNFNQYPLIHDVGSGSSSTNMQQYNSAAGFEPPPVNPMMGYNHTVMAPPYFPVVNQQSEGIYSPMVEAYVDFPMMNVNQDSEGHYYPLLDFPRMNVNQESYYRLPFN